ncbi:MAG: hypothetical protein GDA36_11435 [Rhodobacteraceae bacterium]|nr:hypothetical protein [Paracoccaceae bacterium]
MPNAECPVWQTTGFVEHLLRLVGQGHPQAVTGSVALQDPVPSLTDTRQTGVKANETLANIAASGTDTTAGLTGTRLEVWAVEGW